MQLPRPPAHIAGAGVRALKTVALADGTFDPLERRLIAAVQDLILGVDLDLDDIAPITATELAQAVPQPMFRERIVRGCILVGLIDGDASPAEEVVIRGFADALGVDRAPLTDFQRIVEGRLNLLRIDIARRSFLGTRLPGYIKQEGLRGFANVFKAFTHQPNAKLATRYYDLLAYPEGTLGRAYAAFVRANDFGFPGEVDGAPEPIVFHDCVHVMAEYGTSPTEEAEVVGFQAGFQGYDPFFTLLFVMAQFHLGVQISPIAGTTKAAIEPERWIKALMRGTQCNRDFSDGWDPWTDFAKPLEDLRRTYNILPKEPFAVG